MEEGQADNGNNCHTSHVSGLAEPCYPGEEEEEGVKDLHVSGLAEPCYPGEEEEEEGVKDLHVRGLARINSVCYVQTN